MTSPQKRAPPQKKASPEMIASKHGISTLRAPPPKTASKHGISAKDGTCGFAFDWDDDGFACSKTMGISNLSLFLSHEYHHPDSLQLTNGKDRSKQHPLWSIEKAYYLVEGMMFVCLSSLFWRFGTN
jgi:hypothetical protein